MLALTAEKSDDDVVAEEVGSQLDDLVHITAAGWRRLCQVPADLAHLLSTCEGQGMRGVRGFLDARGVEYRQVGEGVIA